MTNNTRKLYFNAIVLLKKDKKDKTAQTGEMTSEK